MKHILLLAIVASLALAAAAKNLDFALEYRGKCSYANDSGFCRLKAQSEEIVTKIKYATDGNAYSVCRFTKISSQGRRQGRC
jgi:hypothetical protein